MNLRELQNWVENDWSAYPKNKPTPEGQLLLIVEELGEVAEAIRHKDGRKDRIKEGIDIGAEIGDVVVALTTLANTYEIDLSFEIQRFQDRLFERRKGNLE